MSTTNNMIEVRSSNINSIGYDWQKRMLTVGFSDGGRTYEYDNVSPEIYTRLIQADSIGVVFSQLIRRHPEKYPYRRV